MYILTIILNWLYYSRPEGPGGVEKAEKEGGGIEDRHKNTVSNFVLNRLSFWDKLCFNQQTPTKIII